MTRRCARNAAELVKGIERQLAGAVELFYAEIASAFHPVQAFCVAKRKQFEAPQKQAEELKKEFESLGTRIG